MEQLPDISVFMVRPDLRDIPQVPFPTGFGIRAMRADEGPLWTEVQRRTERLFPIGDDLFVKQFGTDPEPITQRCFFVINAEGDAIGTISAWFKSDYKGQDYGQIHWVAIDPAYQGHGLGKAALSYALTCMAEWHERAMLDTSSARIPAIRMYLNFGFVPDMDHPRAEEAWGIVKEHITHAGLENV